MEQSEFIYDPILGRVKCGVDIQYRSDGSIHWLFNGRPHREDGPAVEYPDGYKSWCVYGKLHRENGPAIIKANGDKEWYMHQRRHREDGPAVERADGYTEWWVDDHRWPLTERTVDILRSRYPKLVELMEMQLAFHMVHEN